MTAQGCSSLHALAVLRVCVCVCVVTREAFRHDSMKSRGEIASPVKCAIQVNSSLVTSISESGCHAVVTQTDRHTYRRESSLLNTHPIARAHGQYYLFFLKVYTLVVVVWRVACVGCPVNRYNNNNNNNNNNIYLTAIELSPGGSDFKRILQVLDIVLLKFTFTSGGLHEKHVVASWKVGNRLSVCL